MSDPDISSESEITNVGSATSAERLSNLTDLKALVNTFRIDTMNEDIQKVIRQEIQVKDLPISKELEAMRTESQSAHLSKKFETNREHEQSKFIVNSVDAWIDTALDSLNIVAHAGAMMSLLADVINKHEVQSVSSAALDHGRGLLDKTLAIYSRSIRQAFTGTNLLLCEIDKNDNTRNNYAVNKAIENYEKSCLRYNNGEIDIKEVTESHNQLVQKVEEAEPDETTEVRQEAKKTSRLWKIVLTAGAIIAAPLVIGGVLIVGIILSKK